MNQPNVIVISGPTATGKSSLAVRLIEELRVAKGQGSEIINADSVQIYKGFNIGACKPSDECLKAVPHHLMSYCEANEPFDAGAFCEKSRQLVYDINKRDLIPVVVGGTGLYIRSLLCGLANVPDVDGEIKELVKNRESEFRLDGADENVVRRQMHEWLCECDPRLGARLHANDIARVRRALLVALSCQVSESATSFESFCDIQDAHAHGDRPFRALVLVLMPNREVLYDGINKRVQEMLELGLIDEVKGLRKLFRREVKPFGAIGYRHACDYLDGVIDYPKMVELIQRDTRRYAKRQVTWWLNQPKALGWEEVKIAQFGLSKFDKPASCEYKTSVGNELVKSASELIIDFLNNNLVSSSVAVSYLNGIYS